MHEVTDRYSLAIAINARHAFEYLIGPASVFTNKAQKNFRINSEVK